MTIFRVDVDKDVAKIVKRVDDPAIGKAARIMFKDLDEVQNKFFEIDTLGSKALKRSRDMYKICDTALKKKGLPKKDKEDLLNLRKFAYNFSMKLKGLGIK